MGAGVPALAAAAGAAPVVAALFAAGVATPVEAPLLVAAVFADLSPPPPQATSVTLVASTTKVNRILENLQIVQDYRR
jgi:hypothetical protein